MITISEPAEYPTFVDTRRHWQFVRRALVVLGDRMRGAVCAMSEKLERCFATFAGVPYHDPLDLEEWEQLWETWI